MIIKGYAKPPRESFLGNYDGWLKLTIPKLCEHLTSLDMEQCRCMALLMGKN